MPNLMRLCPAEEAEINRQASTQTCPGHGTESLAGAKMERADLAPRRVGRRALSHVNNEGKRQRRGFAEDKM